MIVKPRIRGFICTTAHPQGCAASVQSQIDYVTSQGDISDGELKNVLVLGCSGGYGLACRIVSAFGCGAPVTRQLGPVAPLRRGIRPG